MTMYVVVNMHTGYQDTFNDMGRAHAHAVLYIYIIQQDTINKCKYKYNHTLKLINNIGYK